MKVVLLEGSGFGGMCHYTYNLCERLSRLKVKVIQISNPGYELDSLPRQFHLEKFFRTDQNYFKKWYLIWRFLVREQVDVFHVQSLITARKDFMGFLIMKLLPFKVVYTAHDVLPHEEEERRAFGMKFAFRWIYRLSDFVITHSEQDKNDIMDTFGVGPARLKAIPHGDYDFCRLVSQKSRPEVRKRYKIRDDEKLVLFFGALRPYKGVHKLISALANVGRRELPMKLLIVGREIWWTYRGESFDEFCLRIKSCSTSFLCSKNFALTRPAIGKADYCNYVSLCLNVHCALCRKSVSFPAKLIEGTRYAADFGSRNLCPAWFTLPFKISTPDQLAGPLRCERRRGSERAALMPPKDGCYSGSVDSVTISPQNSKIFRAFSSHV